MTSMSYWNVASGVQERLNALSALGNEMHGTLESNDDPGEVADFLATIEDKLATLHAQVKTNIPALRKVAKAMEDVPGIR